MIRGIIFDFDHCVFDNSTLGPEIIDPVLAPLISSNVPDEDKKRFIGVLSSTAFDDILKTHPLPVDIAERMRNAYKNIAVPDDRVLRTFGDESYIKSLGTVNILVTSGYEKFQRSKIERTGVAPLFDEIIIDELDVPTARKGKKQIFSEILARRGWKPNEVLAVGDNPLSELRAAQELGIATVQTLRPEVEKWDGADHHIHSFSELQAIVSK